MEPSRSNIILQELIGLLKKKTLGAVDAPVEMAAINKIHADTGIGIKTLKRLFGLETPPENYFPYFGTREILCEYVGEKDWASFVATRTQTEILKEESTPPDEAWETQYPLPSDIHYPNEPFRNLDWFRREDARVFFGRRKAITELVEYLKSPYADNVVLVYGQSGVGKSSFLHAGLLPHLEQTFAIETFRCGKEKHPTAYLAEKINQHHKATAPRVLYIDQFESIYVHATKDPDGELATFSRILSQLLSEQHTLRILISFRKEYYADVDASLTAHDISYKRYFLQPLNAEEIEEAITGLMQDQGAKEKYQLTMDPLVPEKILEMVAMDRNSHIAPTLQIILTKLWLLATKDGKWPPHFSNELFSANIKPQTHFLGNFIDEKIIDLENQFPARNGLGLMLDVLYFFVSEISTATEHSELQILQTYRHIPEIMDVIYAMRDNHLLSDPQTLGKGNVRLAHDALAPLILYRINVSGNPGQKARRLVDSRKLAQGPSGNPEYEFRWDQQAIEVIEAGRYGMRVLSEDEESALKASKQAWEKESRRIRRSRQLQWGGIVAVLVITIISGWFVSLFNTGAKVERSNNLLREVEGLLRDRNPNITGLAPNCLEIIDLGYQVDSVKKQLSQFIPRFALAYRLNQLTPLLPVMASFPVSDTIRQQFYGEAAYMFTFGRQYANALRAAQYLKTASDTAFIPASGNDSCSYIRQQIGQHCGESFLRMLDHKYRPTPILVQKPEPGKGFSDTIMKSILEDFYIAQTEITNFQFLAWLNLSGYTQRDDILDEPIEFYDDRWILKTENDFNKPVVCSKIDARRYGEYMETRLPTELEWDYVANGGPEPKGFVYSGGDDPRKIACFDITFSNNVKVCDVASKSPNSLGIYDMSGNLREWLMDSIVLPGDATNMTKCKGGSYRNTILDSPLKINAPASYYNSGTQLDIGFRPILMSNLCP